MDKNLTDEQIVDLLKSGGNSRYYEILYKRYFPKVVDKCYHLLKNKVQAKEFAEDTLSKAFEKLSSFQQKSSFSTWLYSITYNHCIDYLRMKKKMHYPNWNNQNKIEDIPSEEEVTENIEYEKLAPLLDQIHPEEKALLFMKYIDGFSIKQIGQSLRITETAAKMRLMRARTRLLYLYQEKYLKN